MKLFAPDYYSKFNCTADKCSFTCCRDWKIAVDENTHAIWKKTAVPSNMGQQGEKLSDYVCRDLGDDKIKLLDNGKCPFLNEQGLCRIVKEYGEKMISQTCHTFPREEHIFSDRIEQTLTMGCPAAIELLWKNSEFRVCESDESNLDAEYSSAGQSEYCDEPEGDEALFLFRDRCVALMQDNKLSIAEALKVIFFMALDCYDKEEQGDLNEEYVREIFAQPILQEIEKAVCEVETNPYDSASEKNELFLDLAENYRKKKIYADILEPLAKLAEEYEDEEDSIQKAKTLVDVAASLTDDGNDFENKIRLLLAEEIYSTLFLPGSDLYCMLLKIEWLGIFYAVLSNMIVLYKLQKEKIMLEDLIEIVTVLVRMTGYSDEDIEEYLETSFEDVIWDWGYMCLIVS